MAKIIIDNIEYTLPDGSQIVDICEKHGIPFSCNSGICGTCQIEILEGSQNLGNLNNEEKELAMDNNHRLGCQCKIISGTVKVTF